MTRKRFVKLLMADCYSRNEANELAVKSQNWALSYSTAYKAESVVQRTGIKFNDIDITAVCDAFRKVAEAAIKAASAMAKAMAKAVAAFAEAYTKEMEANHE